MTFRAVADASQRIAEKRGNEEYSIGLSRLSEIENNGTLPTIYRLYALSTIYRLDFLEVLSWYGVNLADQPGDAQTREIEQTHSIHYSTMGFGEIQAPLSLDPGVDLTKTTFLSRVITRWGALPLHLLNSADARRKRYAVVGSEDWSMHPILQPGSLLVINESSRVMNNGWTNEWDRPIYFLETRDGWLCGWCHLDRDRLVVMFHPSSAEPPQVFLYPNDIEIIGQVVAVATTFETSRRRRNRPSDAG
ncbi:MAG: hypothetical protein K7J46_05070 [Bryobacter sp.]|nr:hypothetical protein [Bryobacter sp. CoA8 C33]